MINFEWKIIQVLSKDEILKQVKYELKATEGEYFVVTEGYHSFSEGVVYKPFSEIKEEDLIRWLDKDTTKDEVNIIKLNLEKQIEYLKSNEKADFPWLANTFIME
jgi:hypothetical protein